MILNIKYQGVINYHCSIKLYYIPVFCTFCLLIQPLLDDEKIAFLYELT